MEAPRVFAVEDGWAGLVRCQGRRFWASVAMKNGEAKLSMEAELALLLRGQEGLLQQVRPPCLKVSLTMRSDW